MDVETALDHANITEDFDVVAGHCISIANAIHSVFGGTLVAVTKRPNSSGIAHAAVRIDGTLYDGRGEVTEEMLCKEFADVTRIEPGVMKKHIWEPTPGDTDAFKQATYRVAKTRLETAIEESE